MRILEILDEIAEIIQSNNLKTDENKVESKDRSNNNTARDIIYLFLDFFLTIFKAPFSIFAKFFKNEIITAIKNDAKLYALIMGIMGVLFVFFSVLWLFISFAVCVYFFEKENSLLMSVVYSIGFQVLCFILVSLIAFIASKKIKSIKMMKMLKF